ARRYNPMNTLSRAVTAQLFPDASAYTRLQRQWSALINSNRKHELTAAHHALYLIVRGKHWRKAFTPISNQRKLANGAYYNWALCRGLAALHVPGQVVARLAPFAGLVTPAMLALARSLVPLPNLYRYKPEDFAGGTFPFPAYCLAPIPPGKDETDG